MTIFFSTYFLVGLMNLSFLSRYKEYAKNNSNVRHITSLFGCPLIVEGYYLVRCDAVNSGRSLPTLRRSVLPPSSGMKNKPSK
jgi:hypothetical protein